MNAKQRSAADYFAEKVMAINDLLNNPSSVLPGDLAKWDAVVDHLTKLAEVDYANCNTDAQRMAVIAVLIAALDLRARLRGTSSKPLSDLNDFLSNGAAGKPTHLKMPVKLPGAGKNVNDMQAEVFYVVLYGLFADQRTALNASARKKFGETYDQLRFKRNDLKRRRAGNGYLEKMFDYAEKEISERKSNNLMDYI